jgi:hypothetical protein
MSQELLFGGGGDCDAVVLLNLYIDILIGISIKHNKLLLNSSVNATCFGLTDRHKAIKYII